MVYWITFQESYVKPVCVVLKDHDPLRATQIAQQHAHALVDKVFSLPYPAHPVILNETNFPVFCLHGNECKGYTSCPRNYACSE